jgi:lipase chaperone LimK|tara:strand:+ start:379 stop:600 length:222 start_codon:yes stop_codon:yes gene_type:complete
MNVQERKEQIQEEQKKAFEELQAAQNTVQELTALIQRQNGAIVALQNVLDDQNEQLRSESNGEVTEAVAELVA